MEANRIVVSVMAFGFRSRINLTLWNSHQEPGNGPIPLYRDLDDIFITVSCRLNLMSGTRFQRMTSCSAATESPNV